MRIEIVRVVKAELDETEFETVMLALEQAARYEDDDSSLKENARKMREEFSKAITPNRDPIRTRFSNYLIVDNYVD